MKLALSTSYRIRLRWVSLWATNQYSLVELFDSRFTWTVMVTGCSDHLCGELSNDRALADHQKSKNLDGVFLICHLLHEDSWIKQRLQDVEVSDGLLKVLLKGFQWFKMAFVLEQQALVPHHWLLLLSGHSNRHISSDIQLTKEVNPRILLDWQGALLHEDIY